MLGNFIIVFQSWAAVITMPDNLGLSQAGRILQAPEPCPESTGWGEGISTRGCFVCWPWTGYNPTSTPMPLISPLYTSSDPSLEITIEEKVCKKVSFPCNLVPIFIQPPPRTVDMRHSYKLVDPITNAKKTVGCTQKGSFPSGSVDFYYMTKPTPFIVQTDDLGCKEFTCNKVSLYDINRKRTVEVARILQSDDKFCNADGFCPQLRVVPSPNGETLAVVVWDDIFQKQKKVSNSEWNTFEGHHTVHFIDTNSLLEGQITKTTQRLDSPAGSIVTLEKLTWSQDGSLFGWRATGDSGYTFALFSPDNSKPPHFGDCSDETSFLCSFF
jgi:hypothetical protein